MSEALTFQGRIQRARFRAWHRGTREADYMFGGFFDRYHEQWEAEELVWFEALLDQDDVDVMAWALGTQPIPPRFQGDLIERMMLLDYVEIPR
ncbi:FAD assembly factor SdhE [Qipengyuania sp. SM2507]